MSCGVYHMIYLYFSQYINGGNLEQLLDSNKYLSWATRVKLASDIAMGLSYLHFKGIFHRDLTSKVKAIFVIAYNHYFVICMG